MPVANSWKDVFKMPINAESNELWDGGDLFGVESSSAYKSLISASFIENAVGACFSITLSNNTTAPLRYRLDNVFLTIPAMETVTETLCPTDDSLKRHYIGGAGEAPIIGDVINISCKRISN